MLQDEPQPNPPQGQEVPVPAEPAPVEPAPTEPAAPVEVPVQKPPIETPPSELPSKESVEQPAPTPESVEQPPTSTPLQEEQREQTRDLDELRARSHLSRKQKRERASSKIEELAAQKETIKNQGVRDLLRVSQSTATDYLNALVRQGKLKKTGRGRATSYSK